MAGMLALDTLAAGLRLLARRRADLAADRRLGLRTAGTPVMVTLRVDHALGEGGRAGLRDDGTGYAPTDYRRLELLARALRPGPADVFLDLGCGSGRALAFMSEAGAGRCIGVELDARALAAARANAARACARTGRPIEAHEADAAALPPVLADAASIVYLYNPFGARTLRDVLRGLKDSLARRPRALTVAYYHPAHRRLLDRCGWLVPDESLMEGAQIGLWRTSP